MPEPKREKLGPFPIYLERVWRNLIFVILMLVFCLIIGVLGYHYLADVNWIDSFHNASMILSGMGPVAEIRSVRGKIFSSIYALLSGILFITSIGFMVTPAARKLSRIMQLDEDPGDVAPSTSTPSRVDKYS